LFDYLTIS